MPNPPFGGAAAAFPADPFILDTVINKGPFSTLREFLDNVKLMQEWDALKAELEILEAQEELFPPIPPWPFDLTNDLLLGGIQLESSINNFDDVSQNVELVGDVSLVDSFDIFG